MARLLCYVLINYFLILLNILTVQNYTLQEAMAIISETVDLSEAEWPLKVTNTVLSHMEQNLKYHENNKWNLDIRAGFQLFLTKLNLKAALNHPQMRFYDNNDYQPITSKRLEAIVARATDLNYFFRYQLLGRVPRTNRTRLVAAIFAFTELAWLKFLPPMETGDVNELLVGIMQKKFARNFYPTAPPGAQYVKDAIMNIPGGNEKALRVTEACMQELTQNLLDEALINSTTPGEILPATTCSFSARNLVMCRAFVERGILNKTSGYELLFRLALLTAARIARNCFIFNPYKDRVLRDYLCLVARLEMDKFNPKKFKSYPKNFCDKDGLTGHDFATLCLLNGYKKFMHKRFIECSDYCNGEWNDIGCHGPKGGKPMNITTPLPLWIVVRPSESENKFCYRRLTASCLAHQSGVIRGLVEIGKITEKHRPTLPGGIPVTPSTVEDEY